MDAVEPWAEKKLLPSAASVAFELGLFVLHPQYGRHHLGPCGGFFSGDTVPWG